MKPYHTYTVTWIIELDAQTPTEAAVKARRYQLDRSSLATHTS